MHAERSIRKSWKIIIKVKAVSVFLTEWLPDEHVMYFYMATWLLLYGNHSVPDLRMKQIYRLIML